MEAMRTVLAPNPSPMTLDGTRTYVVGRARPVVIDPGPDDPAHLGAILAALGNARPIAILLTHSHADHSAAAPALAAATGAPVWMARGALSLPFGYERIGRWIGEGDAAETDAGILRAIATPGHAPEHLAFHWIDGDSPDGGALFVGDHFMGGTETTLVAPPEGDLAVYLETLDRIEALAPAILYPAHGPPFDDVLGAIERYRTHRSERIAQVVRALRQAGPSRPDQILDAVYGTGLHPRLRTAAHGSLGAILGYLAATGRARAEQGGIYTLTD